MRRIGGAVACAISWWLIGCREVPAPEGGVHSVSPVQLPSPGVVVGDTMRDSTGNVAPLTVTAFGIDGLPLVPQPPVTFIVIDTGAHFAGPLLVGDSVDKTVRVIGSIGDLQTKSVPVPVTESPDTLVAADSILMRKTYTLISGDTAIASPELSVLVQHLGIPVSGVQAVIVQYSIDQQPPSNGQGPTAVLYSGTVQSAKDTSDASGRASRTVRLRLAALGPSTVDTIGVSASASYRGRVIGTVQFTVIYTKQ